MDYFTTEEVNLMSSKNCIARLVSQQQGKVQYDSCFPCR